ncbi:MULTISPECIES: hypothetical protein [Bacillaceae]|uniref:Spore coat protein B n=1 Tax=Cytobacillus firmus TaxID=1399 RepID=A0AA46SKG1_CYTFI|nr:MULTISPECIES: hypothetical protein [Bacillaceae]KML43630.1 hypothetical protein VL14_06130 [Cytobacillus firmus]UYG96249.1 hypothetical protein OD459_04250 [Cytobacillus firmus]
MENSQFRLALNNLIGFNVKLYTTEGSTIQGLLTGIQDDYVEMASEGNVPVYYKLKNIKGISKSTKVYKKNIAAPSDYGVAPMNTERPNLLTDALSQLKHQWVSINGQNEFSGILSKIVDDCAVLIKKDEQIIFNTLHINTFNKQGALTSSGENKQKNNSNGDTKNSESNKDTNEDANKDSSASNNTDTSNDRNGSKDQGRETTKMHSYSIFGSNTDNFRSRERGDKTQSPDYSIFGSNTDNLRSRERGEKTQSPDYSIFGSNASHESEEKRKASKK